MTLGIDVETYCDLNIRKSGSYKYIYHKSFEILLVSYSLNNGPIETVNLAFGQKLPKEFLVWLTDPNITKTAYNAQFERVCFNRYFDIVLPYDQWECSMVKAGMLGLPMNLEMCGKVLHVRAEKDPNGKKLLRYFTMPCKPTKTNGMRTRNLAEHNTEYWNAFIHYNIRDVESEQEIRSKISFFNFPYREAEYYCMDQQINDYGICLDTKLIKNAIKFDAIARKELTEKAIQLTSLENPNSTAQLIRWLSSRMDVPILNLQKKIIPYYIKCAENDEPEVKQMLSIRQDLSKTSIRKYQAMLDCQGTDGRARGLLQFFGANRTGRFAGRLIQVQNLPRHSLEDLDLARNLVLNDNYDLFEILFNPIDTLSQLIRTALVPSPGNKFIISDFSAIEARVIAWLAGEEWRLKVFRTHGKIYEASGAAMFNVPIESVTKGSALRYKSKIAELALGFGGAVGALIRMGALDEGLLEEELKPLVKAWRMANRKIVSFWYDLNHAALKCVSDGVNTSVGLIKFNYKNKILYVQLPSGRKLSYIHPVIKINKFGSEYISYEGIDQTTKQWKRLEIYGGKFAENIVQATARDLLAEKLYMLHNAGHKIAIHVHDEVVIDAPKKTKIEDAHSIMIKPVLWAKGLPLNADTFESEYYKKD